MEIPKISNNQKRVVIIGAGFAGLTLAKKLSSKYFQVVLVDKNNYHQFQPLLYQVATAGLEPSNISFPLRKIFQKRKNVFIRNAEVFSVETKERSVLTSTGTVPYDFLVMANGASSNYFGMNDLQENSYSMKSVSEALLIRNTLLQNYEKAITARSEEERNALLHIIIVGGGPTGVELAGAIAEMKNKILPKDYPEINFNKMNVCLIEASPSLLNGMSKEAGENTLQYLNGLGVHVMLNTSVVSYDGTMVQLSSGKIVNSRCLVWAAGVKGAPVNGLDQRFILPNHRLLVDRYNCVEENVYAIGDIASMVSGEFPKGHPQVAPVAIQQARNLSKNLLNMIHGNPLVPFVYRDKGSMATVGRNLAVAEIGNFRMKGFLAWICWMLVHLMSIIGVKNRLFIFINWTWQYFTYDQSLRLIIKPTEKNKEHETTTADLIPGTAMGMQ